MSESVLIVDEIASNREELARALDAEGFTVIQSDSTSAAVRDIWANQFLVVYSASVLSGAKPLKLSQQLQEMAPEIETIIFSKGDNHAKLARKATNIRDGHIAA